MKRIYTQHICDIQARSTFSMLLILATTLSFVACAGKQETATETPQQPALVKIEKGVEPAAATSSASEASQTTRSAPRDTIEPTSIDSIPTSQPTSTPFPTTPPSVNPSSKLFPDGRHHRAFASMKKGDSSWLWAYDTLTGKPSGRIDLKLAEALFHVDTDREELFIYSRSDDTVKVFDAQSLEHLRSLLIPSPAVTSSLANRGYWGRRIPGLQAPVIDQENGAIYGDFGPTLRSYDLLSGSQRPTPNNLASDSNSKASLLMSIDESGRFLYRIDPDQNYTSPASLGTSLGIIDLHTGMIKAESVHWTEIERWFAWDNGMVASMRSHREDCCRQRSFSQGIAQRKLTEFDVHWRAYDSKRHVLVGSYGILVTANPDTLELIDVATKPTDFLPRAYDPETDQFYTWSDDYSRIELRSAKQLYEGFHTKDLEYLKPALSLHENLYAPGKSIGPPDFCIGHSTSDEQGIEGESGAKASWHGLIGNECQDPLRYQIDLTGFDGWGLRRFYLSPNFMNDKTVFKTIEGLGVLRSEDAGRTWKPGTAGMDAFGFRTLSVSPDFSRDRKVLATTFTGRSSDNWPVKDPPSYTITYRPAEDHDVMTAWRSSDAGESWESIGRYASLTFSPDYAHDGEIYGFDYLSPQFIVSKDFGTTWTARGQLPIIGDERFVGSKIWVIPATAEQPRILIALAASKEANGGGAQWPHRGARLFRSVDDGHHWDLAWQLDSLSSTLTSDDLVLGHWNVRLFGPFAKSEDGVGDSSSKWLISMTSILPLLFLSSDDGIHWTSNHLSTIPNGRMLSAYEDGRLQIYNSETNEIVEAHLKDLDFGPPEEDE